MKEVEPQQSSKQQKNFFPWKNSIVGYANVDPRELAKNPQNLRDHSEKQRKLFLQLMEDFGWIDEITVNKETGLLIDGHMRLEEALKNNEQTVPVKYVSLTKAQERKALAFYDQIGRWATINKKKTLELLDEIEQMGGPADELLGELEQVASGALDDLVADFDNEGTLDDFEEDEDEFDGYSDTSRGADRAITLFPTPEQYKKLMSCLELLGEHFNTHQPQQTILKSIFWAADNIGAPSQKKGPRRAS